MAFPQTPPQSPFQKLLGVLNSSEKELTQCGKSKLSRKFAPTCLLMCVK